MPLTRSQIIADVRARLHEPTDGRYFNDDPEMLLWLNEATDEIARKVGYEKYTQTISGADYIAALGTSPKYYQLPASGATNPVFMMFDPDAGILINGIRRLGTTTKQLDSYQESAFANISNIDPVNNATIEVANYFTETYTGAVVHYTTEFIIKNEIDAGRTGRLMWFVPNPADTDTITYSYLCLPAYMTSGAATLNLMRQFEEALVYGLKSRAQEKMFNDGLISKAVLEDSRLQFALIISEAQEYMNRSQAPDKRYKVHPAKQVRGMYNTQRRSYLFPQYSQE